MPKLDEDFYIKLLRNPTFLAGVLTVALGIFSFSSSTDPTQAAFYWVGHVGFMLTFFSFWQRSLLRLRVLAVASLVIGLVYNTYIHLHMPANQSLWPVLMWMVIFLVVNVYRSWSDLTASVERSISAAQRPIQAAAFPEMHSCDWVALMRIASAKTYSQGETIIQIGSATPALMILSVGTAQEEIPGNDPIPRQVGTMWGELTWAMGAESFNESPCKVVVTSSHATVLELPYDRLSLLTTDNDRLRLAILDGIVRDQARKNTRLRLDYDVLEPPVDFSSIELLRA